MCTGDRISQALEKRFGQKSQSDTSTKDKTWLSLKRTLTFGAMGMLFIGPVVHMNYCKILPYFVPPGSASNFMIGAKKILID